MMFAELLAEVITWTKRPDLDEASRSAIRRATLKYHRKEYWFKDLTSDFLNNPNPNSPVAIIPLAPLVRFRKLASVRITGYNKPLSPISVDDLLDLDGYARNDVYLVAGTNLNIRWGAGFPTVDVTFYQDPIPTESGYTSWIADQYPDLIIGAATSEVLIMDNESEIYRAARAMEAEQWLILRTNNLEAEAR